MTAWQIRCDCTADLAAIRYDCTLVLVVIWHDFTNSKILSIFSKAGGLTVGPHIAPHESFMALDLVITFCLFTKKAT
jgi:hypothetical protein